MHFTVYYSTPWIIIQTGAMCYLFSVCLQSLMYLINASMEETEFKQISDMVILHGYLLWFVKQYSEDVILVLCSAKLFLMQYPQWCLIKGCKSYSVVNSLMGIWLLILVTWGRNSAWQISMHCPLCRRTKLVESPVSFMDLYCSFGSLLGSVIKYCTSCLVVLDVDMLSVKIHPCNTSVDETCSKQMSSMLLLR